MYLLNCVKQIFQCYNSCGSVVRTATTTPNKPRQRGHAIVTLSLATTYFYFIYLLDAIVTSFVALYRPPRNAVCVCVVITFSRLGINRVWLPILLVVS